MKARNIYLMLAVLLLMFDCLGTSEAATLYFDDFEAYPDRSTIDGHGSWINSGATHQWVVVDYTGYPGQHDGKVLLQGDPLNSDPNADYATLHLHNDAGIDDLKVSFIYLLQSNENGRIDISPDNFNWTDVTSSFGLTPRASDDKTWPASADLAAQAQTAGLQNDLFLRFSAWNPTSNGSWWGFTIDNLKVEAVPEPSTLILLGMGALSLIFIWRRRNRAN
jgi:hypothetical protein